MPSGVVRSKLLGLYSVEEERITVSARTGDVTLRLITPLTAKPSLPVVLYLSERRGGLAQEKSIWEFVVGAETAVAIVEQHRSARAMKDAYATMQWITVSGPSRGLDPSRVAVATDCERAEDARSAQEGDSYGPQLADSDFPDGPHLTGQAIGWFWRHYAPAHTGARI